jgi:hypothetical protein
MGTTHISTFVHGTGVKALALTPCCWPRRREFARGDNAELRELAHMMCLKASSLDTYAVWAKHLWGMLATTAAEATASRGNPRREMAIGVHRDPNIISEKNILLTALKTGLRGCRATAFAQKRYVACARAGTWCRYAALREVYGMPIEQPFVDACGGGPGGRPHQHLKGNVKPLQSLISSQEPNDGNSQSHDSRRRGRKRRREQTAVDDAIILDHLVSRPVVDGTFPIGSAVRVCRLLNFVLIYPLCPQASFGVVAL